MNFFFLCSLDWLLKMFISDVKLVTEFISNLWLTPEEETIVLHAYVLKGRLQ